MKEPTGDGPFPDSWALEPADLADVDGTWQGLADLKFVSSGSGPAMVTLDFIHWYEVPDDVPLGEFLASLSQPSSG